MIKILIVILAIFMGLSGCTTGQHINIVNTYSLSPISYQKVGYKDEWKDLWPIVSFDNGVLIKIHPDSWESLTFGTKNCSLNRSKFYVQFWSNIEILIDFENSYFVSEQEEEISIQSVVITESKENVYDRSNSGSLINLQKTELVHNEIITLWKNNDYQALKDNSGSLNLAIETGDFVGCSRNSYKLYISFNDVNSNIVKGYWLYFTPVEFKSFSR